MRSSLLQNPNGGSFLYILLACGFDRNDLFIDPIWNVICDIVSNDSQDKYQNN